MVFMDVMDYFFYKLAFIQIGYLKGTVQSAILATKCFYSNHLTDISYFILMSISTDARHRCKATERFTREKSFLLICSGKHR